MAAGFGVKHLAMQVGLVDPVVVQQAQGACSVGGELGFGREFGHTRTDASGSQVEATRAAESTTANEEHRGRCQLGLA